MMKTPPPGWVAKYVGIPFREHGRSMTGCDCWGIVWLALAEEFGVDVPIYGDGYETTEDREEIARMVNGALPSWKMVAEERPGDVALFRIAGSPCHCGLVVMAGKMLHTMTGCDAVVESYKIKRWAPRLLGFYRWEAVA